MKKSISKFNIRNSLFTICVLLLIVYLIVPVTAYALTDDEKRQKFNRGEYSWETTLRNVSQATNQPEGWNKETYDALYHNIEELYGGTSAFLWGGIVTGTGNNPYLNLMGAIAEVSKIDTKEGTLFSAFSYAYDALKIIGISLMLLYFLIEMCESFQIEQLSMNRFFSKFIYLAIAIIVIDNGYEIFKNLVNLSNSLTNAVGSAVSSTSGMSVDKIKDTYNAAISNGVPVPSISDLLATVRVPFYLLGIFLGEVVNCLVEIVVFFVVLINLLGRALELHIRLLFAPIGCATIVSGGIHSYGMRYIKKFASVAFQAVIIVGACGAGKALVGAFGNSVSGELSIIASFSTILVGLTLIGIFPKIERIADEVIGV